LNAAGALVYIVIVQCNNTATRSSQSPLPHPFGE
jgi:hypothetical protein